MSAASELRKARKVYAGGREQRKDVRAADEAARRDGAQGGGRQ
jgi:hypothetical protein